MTLIEILLALTIGGIWYWSRSSANLIQLIMQKNVAVLPIWVLDKNFYTAFSLINLILLILQFGLPISLFFFLSIKTSLFVLMIAFAMSVGLTIVFQLIAKGNPMLNYFLGAISSIIFFIIMLANIK